MNFKELVDEVGQEFGIPERLRLRARLFAESQNPTKAQQVNLKNEMSSEEEMAMRQMLRATFCLIFFDAAFREDLRKTYPPAGNN